MRKITLFCLLLVSVAVSAQFTEPGFYRVHNVGSNNYISIKDTLYNKTSNPDAFWPCILMQPDSAQVSDPGSIIYIPCMGEASLFSQGVSTYTLTHLMLVIDTALVREGGKPTYVARTSYNGLKCIFRDYGNGLTAGFQEKAESRWWIEPVNAGSIDTSYLGVKPISEFATDQDGYYWATMTCDFPFLLPIDGGIEGAYTVKEVTLGDDNIHYAAPVKLYGQGDTVPAATPVLLKCKSPYASGNKVVPVGDIANNTTLPLKHDMLMGNYFSNFMNHGSLTDYTVIKEYIPGKATPAGAAHLALGFDADGKLGFFPQSEGTYMAANSAWLYVGDLEQEGITAVYMTEAAAEEPEPEIIYGDLDGDNILSVSDVTLLINYVLHNASSPTQFNLSDDDIIKVADVNQDGDVNVADIVYLINLVLTGEMR